MEKLIWYYSEDTARLKKEYRNELAHTKDVPSHLSVGNRVQVLNWAVAGVTWEVLRFLDAFHCEIREIRAGNVGDKGATEVMLRRNVMRVFEVGEDVIVKDGYHEGRVGFVVAVRKDSLGICEHNSFALVGAR